MHNTPADHGRYEHSDVHAKPLIIVGAILVVATFVSAAIGYWMLRTVFANEAVPAHARAEDRARWNTTVRVQASPPRDLMRYREQQAAITTSYATISSEPEVFSIPVETALEIVAANGFPEFSSILPEGTGALEAVPAAVSEDASAQTPQAPQDPQTPQE